MSKLYGMYLVERAGATGRKPGAAARKAGGGGRSGKPPGSRGRGATKKEQSKYKCVAMLSGWKQRCWHNICGHMMVDVML
jgi:hypothetical protein